MVVVVVVHGCCGGVGWGHGKTVRPLIKETFLSIAYIVTRSNLSRYACPFDKNVSLIK